MPDALLYLYAVTDAGAAPPGSGGVGGAPVRVVEEGALAAVVSPVEAGQFDAEALRRNLEDLRWLEAVARAHDGVVSAVASSGPVAPVRLATVFVDEGGVRAALRGRAAEFTAVLDRVRGRAEWAVKAFLCPVAADATAPQGAAAGPGRAYLERRRAARDGAARHRERGTAEAGALHERLAGLALASHRYPPQDSRLTGRPDEMLLNAAYLLPVGREDALRRVVADAGAEHLRLELTGPWAPYSFATTDRP